MGKPADVFGALMGMGIKTCKNHFLRNGDSRNGVIATIEDGKRQLFGVKPSATGIDKSQPLRSKNGQKGI